MYERKDKGKREFVFKSKKEFKKYFPNKKLEINWRTARNGSYTLTDDKQVVRILDKKKFNNKSVDNGLKKRLRVLLIIASLKKNKKPLDYFNMYE